MRDRVNPDRGGFEVLRAAFLLWIAGSAAVAAPAGGVLWELDTGG